MHHGDFTTLIIQLCIGLLLLTALRHYTRNSVLPGEVWVLAIGILYGIIGRYTDYAHFPKLDLSPDVVLFLLLPLLIFATGRIIKPEILKMEAMPIGLYALVGVLSSAFLIGVPLSYVLDLPLLHALFFGAALAATDPVAVGAIFHRFKMPEELELIVEGESLFNDGTTVVLFQLLAGLVLAGAVFNISETGMTFGWAVLAAFPLGLALGWMAAKILRLWHEYHPFFPVTMTIILALFTFTLAEHFLHISGVIAVLMASIAFVRTHCQCKDFDRAPEDTKTFNSFWEYIAILSNGFLFFVLGAEAGSHPYGLTFLQVVIAAIAMFGARSIVVYIGGRILKGLKHELPMSWLHILNIGGLKGAVSAALILTIPHDYPHRETFLCLAFTLIILSLILQPIIMHYYLKKAKL